MHVGAIFWPRRADSKIASPFHRVLGLLVLWHRRASSRAALGELPSERLRDMGVTELDAAREAARPFWKG